MKTGRGCLMLFSLPFVAVGVMMMFLLGQSLYWWVSVQQWISTPATVIDIQLKENIGSKNSRTYQVVGRYQYVFNGQSFTSEQITLDTSSDNLGDFHQNLFARLERHKRSGEPATCFVNPSEPTEAVMYRGLRAAKFGLFALFGMVFGGVGFGLLGVGIFGFGEKSESSETGMNGVIPSKTSGQVGLSALLAGISTLISLPVLIAVFVDVAENQNFAVALWLILPATAFLIDRWAIVSYLRHKRSKGTVLELKRNPVRAGERFHGVIRVLRELPQGTSVNYALSCTKIERHRHGSKTNYQSEQILLFEGTSLARPAGMGQSTIDVNIEVPGTAPATLESHDLTYEWKLTSRAEIPGANFWAEFEVPVSPAVGR